MTTTAGLIEETRSHLGLPESLNQLADSGGASWSAVATTLTLARDLGPISQGTVLSLGLEEAYVWTADSAAKTVEVRRGHGGSTATTQPNSGLVRVSRYSDFAILRALNAEVRALSGAGIFQVKTLELATSATGSRTYDLAADVVDVFDVRVDYDGTANTWPRVASWTWMKDQETSEFTSGVALRLDSAVPTGRPLRVVYKAALSAALAALADDVTTTTGLRESAHDILPLGAAWRLVAPAEVERNQTFRQGDSRRAEEVPPGAKMRSTLGIQQIRQTRIAEEMRNQQRLYPSRSH